MRHKVGRPDRFFLAAVGAVLSAGCVFVVSPDNATKTLAPLAGGDMTLFDGSSQAFSQPGPVLTDSELVQHENGDALFDAQFVTAPAPVHPGLGPLFGNNSCVACHVGDGRGRPPDPGQPLASMLFRISAPGQDVHGGPNPMPGYGVQIQDKAVAGVVPEASVAISYRDSLVMLNGGDTVTLRVPSYTLQNPWAPLTQPVLLSPRVAPSVFGLGLLEAVDSSDIVSRADPDDGNNDGISGRPNIVYSPSSGGMRLGRFGWKANTATVEDQTGIAFNQDMGITNPLLPEENCAGDRPECAAHPLDVDSISLADVTFYVQSLAVPGRRDWDDSTVQEGEQLFTTAGCVACHVPELHTGQVANAPFLSGQTIHPYTDLLLHDMGPGLADGRPDYLATGQEWRTAPLWGIGLIPVVDGHSFFLHDGRARNLLEALLWHGGEAAAARAIVVQMSNADRHALIAFLQSL